MNEPLQFEGYRIVRKLGSGAMGDVYEAVDLMLERPVALKVVRPEIAGQPELIERFRTEAVALARLNHPNIAAAYSFFQQQGRYCMVMEFVRGCTLSELLGNGRCDPGRAAALMTQVLDALGHAHGMGVMHRDVKPANIMVAAGDAVKVTDFGIARIVSESRMTREGRVIGTLEYIAPERISGVENDFRSDLYSAGIVLYELLAGRLPFVSDTDYALMAAHMNQPPPPMAALGVNCPPPLEAVVQRALAKNPNERFQSCHEFRQALATALAQCAIAMAPTQVMAPPPVPAPPATRLAASGTGYAPVAAPGYPPGPGTGYPQTHGTGYAPVAGYPPAAYPSPQAGGMTLQTKALIALAAGVVCIGAGVGAYFLGRPAASPAAAPATPAVVAQSVPTPEPQPAAVAPPVAFEPVPQQPILLPPTVTQQPVVRTAQQPAVRPPAETPAQTPAQPAALPPAVAAAVAEPTPTPAPATPASPRRLNQVKALFVANMEDDLDKFLREEIRERLGGHIKVVAQRGDADAILSGSRTKRGGVGSTLTLGIKAGYAASVEIRDAAENRLLWSAEADDSRAGLGAIKRGGARRVAEKLASAMAKQLGID